MKQGQRSRPSRDGLPKLLIAVLVLILCATWAVVVAEVFLDWDIL
jgi:hypothetical protein